jgi:hypothetical protein
MQKASPKAGGKVPANMRQEILSETFTDVNRLLWTIARKSHAFHNYVLDLESDIFPEACVSFIKAYDTWDTKRSKSFVKWLFFRVFKDLQELHRRAARHEYRFTTNAVGEDWRNGEVTNREVRDFRLLDLLDSLSPDACMVVRLALDTPQPLLDAMREHRSRKWTAEAETIKDYLMGLGWEEKYVNEIFDEIRKALR